MRKYIKFYKTHEGRWYAFLPEHNYSEDEREMVCGADTMLDCLAQGDNLIELCIDTQFFSSSQMVLNLTKTDESGGYYSVDSMHTPFEVWLCNVTLGVFGEFPEQLIIGRI